MIKIKKQGAAEQTLLPYCGGTTKIPKEIIKYGGLIFYELEKMFEDFVWGNWNFIIYLG